jgi:hypothetical protein
MNNKTQISIPLLYLRTFLNQFKQNKQITKRF